MSYFEVRMRLDAVRTTWLRQPKAVGKGTEVIRRRWSEKER